MLALHSALRAGAQKPSGIRQREAFPRGVLPGQQHCTHAQVTERHADQRPVRGGVTRQRPLWDTRRGLAATTPTPGSSHAGPGTPFAHEVDLVYLYLPPGE